MLIAYLTDLMYLGSDLVTGKSLPLLLGVTALPIDQHLLAAVLFLGVSCGVLFTLWKAQQVREAPSEAVAWAALGHHSLSCFVTAALVARTAVGVDLTPVMVATPLVSLMSVPLPQRESTVWVGFLLNLSVLAVSCFLLAAEVVTPAPVDPWDFTHTPSAREMLAAHDTRQLLSVHDNTRQLLSVHDNSRQLLSVHDNSRQLLSTHDNTRELLSTHDNTRQLLSISRDEWYHQHNHLTHPRQPDPVHHEVGLSTVLGRAVLLFTLAFYASVQHGPVSYHDVVMAPKKGTGLVSIHFSLSPFYAFVVCVSVCALRLVSCLLVGLFHTGEVHLLLEGSRGEPNYGVTAWVYLTALLYSLAWNVSQLREYALEALLSSSTAQVNSLRLSAVLVACSTAYKLDPTWPVWGAALVMCVPPVYELSTWQ